MFHTILVPLDGSLLAERVLPHAAAIASAFDASVRLLRVIPVRRRGGAAPLDIIDRRLGQVEATAYLDAVASDLRARNVRVSTELLEGQPAEQILEVLRRTRADLVMLTTHGAGGSTGFPISGTAWKILSRAGTSVLLVPVTAQAAPTEAAPGYHRILVALDGSRRGLWALAAAEALAVSGNAELILAHVVPVPETVDEPPSSEVRETVARLMQLNEQAAREHLEAARMRLESGGVQIRARIETSASVPEALSAVAKAEQADLMIFAAHGPGGASPAYGPVAAQLLAEAARPVLVAQDAPRIEPRRIPDGWQRRTAPRRR